MDPGPTWTDIAGVAILALQLVLLGVAALYARGQVAEARQLRRDQARPFVVVDFEIEQHLIHLAISNIGNTLARDVKFTVEPPFASALEGDLDLKILSEGIPTLPPGKKIRTLFDSAIQRGEDLPDAYSVTASYTDGAGKAQQRYEDRFTLDLAIYTNLSWVERRSIHDVYKVLDKMQKEMHKWTASSGGGLLRLSPQEKRDRDDRMHEAMAERRKARSDGAEPEASSEPPPAAT